MYKKTCPKCGSTDVHVDFSNPVVWSEGTQTKYKCHNCEYVGYFFPEVSDKRRKDFRKKVKHKKHKYPIMDAKTGESVAESYVMGLLIIIGIILVIAAVFYRYDPIYRITMIVIALGLFGFTYLVYREARETSS